MLKFVALATNFRLYPSSAMDFISFLTNLSIGSVEWGLSRWLKAPKTLNAESNHPILLKNAENKPCLLKILVQKLLETICLITFVSKYELRHALMNLLLNNFLTKGQNNSLAQNHYQ